MDAKIDIVRSIVSSQSKNSSRIRPRNWTFTLLGPKFGSNLVRCATPRLHRTRRTRLTSLRSHHSVRGHRSIPKNRFQFRDHASGLAFSSRSSVLLPVSQLPYSSKRSYGSAGSASSLSLLASGFWAFIVYARCVHAVDIHESCMHTNASNQTLQPTATCSAFTFFMTKPLLEIFSLVPDSRG